jgi:hypothetical protein
MDVEVHAVALNAAICHPPSAGMAPSYRLFRIRHFVGV